MAVVSSTSPGLNSADLSFLHEVWRMRAAMLESLYRLLGASRMRTAPYRRVSRLVQQGYLEAFLPDKAAALPPDCRQLIRVGPRGREALAASGLIPSHARPRYVRSVHYTARLEAVDWYARARAQGVPAEALLFREEYRERFGWGPWCPGDLALLKDGSLLVLVRAADLGDTPAGDLLRLVDSWCSRCSLAVVVPDRLHGAFCAELSSLAGEPPVPVIPVSEVGDWLLLRWRGAEGPASLARMVVEERLGPVDLGSALSEYPSFVGSFRHRGLLYGLCSLLDPAVELGRVVSDLRSFRPSTLPGRYRGVVVVVRSPEQAVWLAKRIPGGDCVWIVSASHPKTWYGVRAGGLRLASPPGGGGGG